MVWNPVTSITSRRVLACTIFGLLGIGMLSACSPTVSLDPANGANTYGCAEVSVRLPTKLGSLPRRQTDAQSTAAWGTPAAVIARCGVTAPKVSTLRCLTVANVDWLIDESQAPKYTFISYGRSPATEVIVDSRKASGDVALTTIADAIKVVPATSHCK